jgi:endonuclease/exonuclease/phosphatase family metal-dependent hydrolase
MFLKRFRQLTLAAAAFCWLVACAHGGSVQTAQPLRVMTFNIRYGTAPDSNNAWQLRRPLTFQVIRDFQPSVLGVQEALRFQLDEIEAALGNYAEAGVGRDDGAQRGEYSAILFDRRRLELLDHATFWLSDTPQTPGSMTWGNHYPRIVTWARFRDRSSGDTFYVFNTHWDHESQPSRERSAALLTERIKQRAHPNDPVLVTGDFNSGEDNPAFQALLRSGLGLYDSFRAVQPSATGTGTFHAFKGDRSGPKIDAILASQQWRTLNAGIILLSDNGRYPSDHFPVTATLVTNQ